MTVITQFIISKDVDTHINSYYSTNNYGASVNVEVGVGGIPLEIRRAIFRFKIPNYSGTLKKQNLYFAINSCVGVNKIIAVHVITNPKDDLLVEGTSIGAPDAFGCSWNRYAEGLNWTTGGGDYAVDPVVIYPHNSYIGGVFLEIPLDNFKFEPGKTYAVILKLTNEAIAGPSHIFITKDTASVYLDVERDDSIASPTLNAIGTAVDQITLTWNQPKISIDEFLKYDIYQSDTGAFTGEQTLLTTSTNFNTLSYIHTLLVVQADVHLYDHALDTYPNGRKKYYKLYTYTNIVGALVSTVKSGTTFPMIKSFYFEYTPRSLNYAAEFSDNNQTYKPYGIKASIKFISDTSPIEHINHIQHSVYYKKTGVGWGAIDEGGIGGPSMYNVAFPSFELGAQIKGGMGYVPYKIMQGRAMAGSSNSRPYRLASKDKINPQTEITYPAPCPVAIPRGKDKTTTPPDFYSSPANGGVLFSELKYAAQQSGDALISETFTGTIANKWFSRLLGGGLQTLAYMSSPNRLIYATQLAGGIAMGFFSTKLCDYSVVPSEFYVASPISKYTGAYNINLTKTVLFSDGIYAANRYSAIGFCGWSNYASPYSQSIVTPGDSSSGYQLLCSSTDIKLYRTYPLYTHTTSFELLLTAALGVDSPLNTTTYGRFLHFEIIVSPLFDITGVLVGDRIYIVYKKDVNQLVSETIDLDTHPYVWIIDSVTRAVGEQINYTGTVNIGAVCGTNSITTTVSLYKFILGGKIKTPQTLNSGFGLKNETLGITYPMGTTTPTGFSIFCLPSQASQLIYLEGRIKNEFGAQSPNTTWSGKKGSTLFQGGVINNIIPIAFLSAPKVGFTGTDVIINCSQSIDPEGGALVYELDFGDGTTEITISPIVTKQYSTTGDKIIKLKVLDEAGLYSSEIQTIISILNAIEQFQEITLMSPWTSISENSPTGTSVTSLAEIDYDVVQTMPGGNRVFSLSGLHNSLDATITEAQRMALNEAEREYFQFLKNSGALITLDLEFFGKVKGVITEHNPSMSTDDQSAFGFSMTFQEVRLEQFGA